MSSLYLALRAAKVLAVATFFSGVIGAVFARALEERRRFAFYIAGPGFGATWALGFTLAWVVGHSIASLWIVGAMVLSLFALQVVLFSVGREGRRGPVTALLAIGALVACVALMLFKPLLGLE
jgi:hypothetical protein